MATNQNPDYEWGEDDDLWMLEAEDSFSIQDDSWMAEIDFEKSEAQKIVEGLARWNYKKL